MRCRDVLHIRGEWEIRMVRVMVHPSNMGNSKQSFLQQHFPFLSFRIGTSLVFSKCKQFSIEVYLKKQWTLKVDQLDCPEPLVSHSGLKQWPVAVLLPIPATGDLAWELHLPPGPADQLLEEPDGVRPNHSCLRWYKRHLFRVDNQYDDDSLLYHSHYHQPSYSPSSASATTPSKYFLVFSNSINWCDSGMAAPPWTSKAKANQAGLSQKGFQRSLKDSDEKVALDV